MRRSGKGQEGVNEEGFAHAEALQPNVSILADISRSDVLVYAPAGPGEAVVLVQARPHSISPIHTKSMVARVVGAKDAPEVLRTLVRGRVSRGSRGLFPQGGPVVKEVWPLKERGRVIGALSTETNLLEYERHMRRSKVFQWAVTQLKRMVVEGTLKGAEELSPFGEYDGIVVLDAQGRFRYLSGVATSLFRRLGYMDSLLARRVATLDTADGMIVAQALEQRRCVEQESEERGLTWIRKAIPLLAVERRPFSRSQPRVVGVLLTIHDATEARKKERELRVRTVMMQEIHHRVKNNLQTIASLLRLQARRADSPETQRILQESISRILSIAVVHEFLSQQDARLVNIKEVLSSLLRQAMQGTGGPEKGIGLSLEGPSIYLPTQQATACALVVNELVQNSLQHGYVNGRSGGIWVKLNDVEGKVSIEVKDEGVGLPERFNLDRDSNLGLRIVQTLVKEDLAGDLNLRGNGPGVSTVVSFVKPRLGGEEPWKGYE